MPLNKRRALAKLPTLTWEELDWLEQKCRSLKEHASGPRVYSSTGDATHVREAARALVEHFDDVLYKHHGG